VTASRVLLIIAVGIVGAMVCGWQARRALAEPPTPTATGDEWVYDGPDSLRLLEVADLHLNQCAAADARLWDAFAPGAPIPDLTTHPDFDAGYDRLRDAIREHREEEEL
jgi:hypothetical protein